ncbi:uncharacterized protein BJ171DRAFT_423233 [Polychytrium aggregatum]|uniref:uncharacterized protein n=1 Tax=Polychytrium aggregatum TaxID=110093 RepID=UPI0022FEA3B8|nr:uncharacterized protein BJ171DRAFT_423233 [Polychytrium aggregatum]KAI9205412.1 hypothetical protein BJ171DRAFT_423233 [Polychytrium aggregatum]
MIGTIFAWVAVCSLATFLVPFVISLYLPVQNLKKKYNAEWALVTGGSSGIGLAIARRCAEQGINVVIVALPNELLKQAMTELQRDFPQRKFIAVEADLSKDGFMDGVIKATDGLDIQLIFSNAGYIVTSFFAETPLETVLANYNTNATASIKIAHHFSRKLIAKKLKGFICFTSSGAAYLPTPLTSMYGPTKVFLTNLGAALAAELRPEGVDVMVVHPSPIASNFYKNSSLDIVVLFKKTAASPSVISDAICRNAGYFTLVDDGYFGVTTKLILKVLDWSLFGEIMKFAVPITGDYKQLKAKAQKTN